MTRLKLTVNEEKTHVRRVPEQYFDFLGYTFGRFYSTKTGRAYLGTRPSKKSVQRMIAKISECTDRSTTCQATEEVVQQLNRKLLGWANYFKLGPVSKAYQVLDRHTTQRLSRWLCIKHKVKGVRSRRYSAPYLQRKLGLIRLPRLTKSLPWANA